MRYVLHFVSLIKYIEFVLELQGDTQKVLCSLFEKKVTVHGDNQGAIVLAVAVQIRPHIKHIVIKYHHFWSFFANVDV